jgi:Flagellar hook capping protein - N-terminal region
MDVSSLTATQPTTNNSSTTTSPPATVNYNQFLQLLIAQMKKPGPDQSNGHVAIHEPVCATIQR